MSNYQNGCLICGQELRYHQATRLTKCLYCQGEFETSVTCPNGHYICDACHGLDAMEVIETFCQTTHSTDPLEIALTLMKNPKLKMHGPEHHFLVPASLMAAYANETHAGIHSREWLYQARLRATKVPGGFCGSHGGCGGAIGVGIFVSVVTGSTPLSTTEWQMSNRATSRALQQLSDLPGPRCCKRSVYISILEGIEIAKDFFDVKLRNDTEPVCLFSEMNRQCLMSSCPFYQG